METLERTVDQCDSKEREKLIVFAPIVSTTTAQSDRNFGVLKNSSAAINCVNNPLMDEGIQVLPHLSGEGYFFLYAGRDPSLAEDRAREYGLIIDSSRIRVAETLDNMNTYLRIL